jgi:hypothetical protein
MINEESVVQDVMHETGHPVTRVTPVSKLDEETDDRGGIIGNVDIIWADLCARPGKTKESSRRASHAWEFSRDSRKPVAGTKSSRTTVLFKVRIPRSLKVLW